jgi:hypothetical protein
MFIQLLGGCLLTYLVLGGIVLQFLLDGLVIKGSSESFLELAGDPTLQRFIEVLLIWPRVLVHVLLVRWPLPKRETVYRTVCVQNRLGGHYELETATLFLGRCYGWRAVMSLNDATERRQFKDWATAVNAAKQLNERELNQRFKSIRRAGPAFSGRIWLP